LATCGTLTYFFLRGQNSRATLMPACAPREKPAEENPDAIPCAPTGAHAREIKALPITPDIWPEANVFSPVVVFRVITVLINAYPNLGPKPVFSDR